MIKEAAASIKKVWNYEKTINADIRALQNMLVIFAIVMLLIDVENFKLGKYVIGGATLFAAGCAILKKTEIKEEIPWLFYRWNSFPKPLG